MSSASLSYFQQEAIHRVRLNARHGLGTLSKGEIAQICKENILEPKQVLMAQQEGLELLAKGMRCMCTRCGANGEEINDRERMRQAYSTARHAQLTAQGIEPMERERIINAEIDSGAALQTQPVTVIRSTT